MHDQKRKGREEEKCVERKTGWNKRVARRKSECRNNAKTKSKEGKRSVSRENGRKNGMTVEARMMIMTVIAGMGMMMIGNHRRDDDWDRAQWS